MSPRSAPASASARSTNSAAWIDLCSSPAIVTMRSSPSNGWARDTFSSVTTNRRPSPGWKKPDPIRPWPRNTGYSPDDADAHTRRVPAGASPSARSAGSARRRASRSEGGSTASATDA